MVVFLLFDVSASGRVGDGELLASTACFSCLFSDGMKGWESGMTLGGASKESEKDRFSCGVSWMKEGPEGAVRGLHWSGGVRSTKKLLDWLKLLVRLRRAGVPRTRT